MNDQQHLTDQQLDEYETLANAATPGPWTVDSSIPYGHRVGSSDDADWVAWTGEHGETGSEADAAYIAAMSPEVAKALVAEVRRLRARVTELEAGIQWRDEERRRWVDVHNLVERAIDKGWSSVDTLDLEAELGPEPAVRPVPAASEEQQ